MALVPPLDRVKRGHLWWREEWLTICSAHAEYDEDCSVCQWGCWSNVWEGNITRLFYRYSPRLWTWWVNR